jgi:polar amino acid transport system substrate-binding protein
MPPSTALTRRRAIAGAAGLCALPFGWGLAAAQGKGEPDQLDRILRSRVLRVAVPQEFPPFGFTRNGVVDGFDIAVARMLASDLRVSLKILPVASGDRLAALLEDRVDLIIASLGKTAEREREIDFSTAYAPTYMGIFSDSGAGPADLAALKGRRVGVVRGSLEETEFKAQAPHATAVAFDSSAPMLDAYVRRSIDAFAAGNVVAESIPDTALRERIKRVAVLRQSPCHIGVRKHEPRLLARVDAFLAQARSSQALMVNAMHWFKHSLSPEMFRDGKG